MVNNEGEPRTPGQFAKVVLCHVVGIGTNPTHHGFRPGALPGDRCFCGEAAKEDDRN